MLSVSNLKFFSATTGHRAAECCTVGKTKRPGSPADFAALIGALEALQPWKHDVNSVATAQEMQDPDSIDDMCAYG